MTISVNISVLVFSSKRRKSLANILPSPEYAIENANDLTETRIKEDLEPFDTVLISLFVPKAKPLNKFDLEDSVLEYLGQLFQTKKCILYVFGNPYALQVIPNLEHTYGIVEMYQDFVEFQQSAAEQLLEDKKAKGTLPISITSI